MENDFRAAAHVDCVDRLANNFIEVIREWLTPEQCREVDQRNRAEVDANICHTHDFMDANQAMEQAYVNMWGEEPDLSAEGVMDDWGDAWMLAKARGFEWLHTKSEVVDREMTIKRLRKMEEELRTMSVDLWMQTVDDPETVTVESEEAGMTPERKAIRKIMDRVSSLADKVEEAINNTRNGGETTLSERISAKFIHDWLIMVVDFDWVPDVRVAIHKDVATEEMLTAADFSSPDPEDDISRFGPGTSAHTLEMDDIDGLHSDVNAVYCLVDSGIIDRTKSPLIFKRNEGATNVKQCECDEPERETRDGGRSVVCVLCGGEA